MENLKEIMAQAEKKTGGGVKFTGLITKRARIRHSAGSSKEDVLGWDYFLFAQGYTCYRFYAS